MPCFPLYPQYISDYLLNVPLPLLPAQDFKPSDGRDPICFILCSELTPITVHVVGV